MPDQIPREEKADRAHRAAAVAAAMEQSWLTSWIGRTVPVLFEEEEENGLWRGYTPQYVEVRARGADLHNAVRPVAIHTAGPTEVFGTLTEEGTP